jgi:hypothetical protein
MFPGVGVCCDVGQAPDNIGKYAETWHLAFGIHQHVRSSSFLLSMVPSGSRFNLFWRLSAYFSMFVARLPEFVLVLVRDWMDLSNVYREVSGFWF